MPIPTLFGQNQVIAGGGGGFPAFPSIASEWGRWEPFRETGYSDGDQINPLTDWSGNGRDWTTTGTRPQYKVNVLNGLAVADASIGGAASGWDTGPDMSGLTEVHAFMIALAQSDPALDIGETGIYNLGTDILSAHVPYIDGNVYDDAFRSLRITAGNPTLNLASAFRMMEIISTTSEWTWKINGTETLFTTGINTVSCPAAPALLQACRHKMAGFYMFSAKLTTERASLLSYFNDAAVFNQGWS